MRVPEHYLSALNREASLIHEHLEIYDFEDRCDINPIKGATVERIFNTVEKWQKRKDLVLFHYGGHASGASLLLNTEDAHSLEANAEGLARMLGQIPSLQLVFLNGCSTKDQVKLLLDKGVRAVIATSKPIQDNMAVDFADHFYKNMAAGSSIGIAFDRAKNLLSTKYKHQVFSTGSNRDLIFDVADSEKVQEGLVDLPWGLYFREESKEVLNWSLPQKPTVKSRFGEVDQFACNRFEQNSAFKTQFLSSKGEEKIQLYFIHGEEKQSPRGLFKRFVLEHIQTGYHRAFDKVAIMEEASELKGAKINFLTALFKAVELEPNRFKRSELTLHSAAKAPALRDVDCVAIKFKVYSSAWKPFTGEFIQWFLDELSNSEGLGPHAPDFLFFFSVIYEEPEPSGFFNRLLKKNPKEQILKTMKRFPKIQVLKELPPVKRSDINQWMDRLTEDPIEKEEELEQYFPKQAQWEMARVERILGKMINAYKEKDKNAE